MSKWCSIDFPVHLSDTHYGVTILYDIDKDIGYETANKTIILYTAVNAKIAGAAGGAASCEADIVRY